MMESKDFGHENVQKVHKGDDQLETVALDVLGTLIIILAG